MKTDDLGPDSDTTAADQQAERVAGLLNLQPPEPPAVLEIDHAQLEVALDRMRSDQNLLNGVLAGLVAAATGAGIWAGITVITDFQIGWMAVGVGFLVGLAVRTAGNGVDPVFGYVGATLALAGCVAGNLLTVSVVIAAQEGIALTEVVAMLDLPIAWELLILTFSPIDLLFYGIALYEGYKLSFRRVSPQDLGVQSAAH